jgi:uncharacterized protein (DUF1697 family)
MPCYIALLRGVNIVGRRSVPMSDLRALCESLGFSDARTLLQSGNLILRCGRRDCGALERQLERETAKRFGGSIGVFVRTPDEWQAAIDRNPFPREAQSDPGHLLATFLKRAPTTGQVAALESAIRGPERIRAIGRQLYVVYPDGVGKSKLTHAMIEKHLGTSATARNWNTVLKLQTLAATPA